MSVRRLALIFAETGLALVLGWPRPARAQIPPLQVQIIAVGMSDITGENFGGEIQANLAVYGVGLAIGLGGEGLRRDGGYDGGGTVHLAIQLRPVMFFALIREYPRPAYQVFDPHLDVGGMIGGISAGDGAAFRGVFYIGGALDFAIPLRFYWMDSQLLLSVGYRWVPYQTPASGPEHYLLFGIGWRGGL